MKAAAEILRALVGIPSVSSQTNRPLIEFVQQWFSRLDWHERIVAYRDPAGVEKLNLLVSPQPLSDGTIDARLAVVCHTDTVPFEETWTEATRLIERDGMLHGCGACDVKGFLACMLAAAAELQTPPLRHRLVFVFTSDEEVGCRGAKFLLSQDALHAGYAIVGEPTSLLPARAGKGYGLAEVLVTGKAAHSAFPEAGRSAILAAAKMLRSIDELARELETDRNDAFSPAWTTVNVGEIRGGTAKNIVAAECSFLVEWRPVPSQDPNLVGEHLQRMARELSQDGIEISVRVTRAEAGFETSAESILVGTLLGNSGGAAQTLAFGTEAPWLARMGAEAVVFGPGSMLTAHSPRECVPKKELDDCVRMLRAAIEHLCSE